MSLPQVSDDDVRTVVQLAGLAPSVHNTQPWRFRWDGVGLTVLEEPSRALPVLDPSGRARVLSCGAAVLHARLGFAELGYEVRTAVLPDGADEPALARLDVVARAQVRPREHELAQAIPRRATDREPFSAEPLSEGLLQELRAEVELESAWLDVLDADEQIEVHVLLAHADQAQRENPDYVRELQAWRRDDDAVGVPSKALSKVPPGERGSSLTLRDFDAGGGAPPPRVASNDVPVAEHPTVAVVVTRDDGRADWVAAGQAVARLLLRGASLGVAAQPLTQVLEVPALRARLRHAVGSVGHPQMLLRLGYGAVGPSTRRLPVEQVLEIVPRS